MKAILLDGSKENDSMGGRMSAALSQELQARGWETEIIVLRDQTIGNCAGDFFCWVRNPGVCNVNDDNRRIADEIVNSNLMVYLTPVMFGGYSSGLKRIVDHQIQNIAPFFAKINGETHHAPRYTNYPDFLALGWQDEADTQAEAVFRQLTTRNAINFYAKNAVSAVVLANQTGSEIQAVLSGCLDQIQNGCGILAVRASEVVNLPAAQASPFSPAIRRAVLLVGSPRTKKSTSHSLGGYVLERLEEHSIQTETIYLHTILKSTEKMQAMFDAVDQADLLLLAFPLYVDSLPAPVIEALERIATRRHERKTGQMFAAIANCGFPEAHHNDTALAICGTFARQAGFIWAGSLALGAGEGMVHGGRLDEMDGRVTVLKQALKLAAEALAQGQAIPNQAQALLAKPFIPAWLYRLMGSYGWQQQAKGWGMAATLKNKPYAHIKE